MVKTLQANLLMLQIVLAMEINSLILVELRMIKFSKNGVCVVQLKFNTLSSLRNIFQACNSIISIDLSQFFDYSVENTESIFSVFTSLQSINLGKI